MTPKPETVLVVLGIRLNRNNPMPATITQWRGKRHPSYQHLSPEQHAEMGEDQTALWEATWLDGRYWLEKRLPNPPPREVQKEWGTVVLSEDDIPF